MTRARCVLGTPEQHERFEEVRRAVIATKRDQASLALEIAAMRQRMRQGHPVAPGLFDLKHSPGGMIDIEFAVQYLVLAHGAHHPQLWDNVGNIALLQRAQAAGLLAAPVGEEAAQAYRQLRHWQHQARLDELEAQLPLERVQAERSRGLALWQALFGGVQLA